VPGDLPLIGVGTDVHPLTPERPLYLAGLLWPGEPGLAGHSDGDVLLHALTDALLGAVAAGDIGAFFPPGDPKWKGADSVVFVREAMNQVRKAGFAVVNVDSTLILMTPKIGPHAAAIRARIAKLLGTDVSLISVKAKTPEGLNLPNTAAAHVVVLLERHHDDDERAMQVAESMPQSVVDAEVEQVLEKSGPELRKRRVRERKTK